MDLVSVNLCSQPVRPAREQLESFAKVCADPVLLCRAIACDLRGGWGGLAWGSLVPQHALRACVPSPIPRLFFHRMSNQLVYLAAALLGETLCPCLCAVLPARGIPAPQAVWLSPHRRAPLQLWAACATCGVSPSRAAGAPP